MNRSQIQKIEMSFASCIDEARLDAKYSDVKLAQLKIAAGRVAENLGLDTVKFLKRCGFKYDRQPV